MDMAFSKLQRLIDTHLQYKHPQILKLYPNRKVRTFLWHSVFVTNELRINQQLKIIDDRRTMEA